MGTIGVFLFLAGAVTMICPREKVKRRRVGLGSIVCGLCLVALATMLIVNKPVQLQRRTDPEPPRSQPAVLRSHAAASVALFIVRVRGVVDEVQAILKSKTNFPANI
jgi:hypothetical protein